MRTPYFSRNSLYKTPFGAVDNGTAVTFRLILPFDCSSAVVAIQRDGELQKYYQLSKEENTEQDGVWWSCTLGPFSVGLYFYYFEFDTPFGHNVLYKGKTDGAVMNSAGRPYQLTVFDQGYTPPDWLCGGLIYQIFPDRFCKSDRSFTKEGAVLEEDWYANIREYAEKPGDPVKNNHFFGGDLYGVASKLEYLESLGVTMLYLNPIFKAASNHRYDTGDYSQVDELLGGEEGLRYLLEVCRDYGIEVILDGVFNHSGVHFAPFQDMLAQGEASRYRDWFFPKRFPIAMDAACYECVGDYPYMPRLNTGNPEVQDFVLSVMRYWIQRCGVDGWRMDVADELDTACVQFLRRRLKAEFPQALLLGETWGDATRMLCGGDQFDSVMNYLFRDCMVDYFAHGAIDERQLDERLQHMRMKYPEETSHYLYNCLSSHDTARFLTEARGEKWRLKLALAFQMLYPGCPALYYGEEIGMEGENDPGCRGGMAWERQDEELLGWVKELIWFRRRHEAVRRGAYRTILADPDKKLFAFERRTDGETITVIFNSGDRPQDFAAEAGTIPAHAVKIIPS